MRTIDENGLYIGKYGNDFYLFRVEWLTEELSWKDYDDRLSEYTCGQPVSGKSPPLQWVTCSSMKDIEKLRIFNQPEEESFITWMNYSFNWSKVMVLWLENEFKTSYDYVKSFNKELEQQWENGKR